MDRRKTDSSIGGFTLIESIFTIMILTMIGFAALTFQRNVFSLSAITQENLVAQQQLRQIFSSMAKEIRPLSPSSTGTYPIESVSTTSFSFYSDGDKDGRKERIRYYLSGKSLMKGVIKATGTPLAYQIADEQSMEIVKNLNNGAKPIFEYFDSDYDGSTPALLPPIDIPAIRLVKITLIVDRYVNRSPSQIEMSTQIMMRNLKDNQ